MDQDNDEGRGRELGSRIAVRVLGNTYLKCNSQALAQPCVSDSQPGVGSRYLRSWIDVDRIHISRNTTRTATAGA